MTGSLKKKFKASTNDIANLLPRKLGIRSIYEQLFNALAIVVNLFEILQVSTKVLGCHNERPIQPSIFNFRSFKGPPTLVSRSDTAAKS